jgi:aminotransferase
VGGIDELKDAVTAKLQRDNRLTYKRSEVVISCGAKHSLFNIAHVLFEEGDEVLIPSPYWVSYTDIVYLTGAQPVVIKTSVGDGFKLQPSQLEAAITPRTRAIIISSPSNPAGVTYTLKEIESLAEVIVRKRIMVISDDIYEKIIYDGHPFYTLASLGEELKRLSIVVNGVSKTYSMTGWRIGYLCAPKEIADAALKIHQYVMLCAPVMGQIGATEALRSSEEDKNSMVNEYRLRRNMFVSGLNRIGLSCHVPEGAFYAFPSVKETGLSDQEFAERLLKEQRVAVVPGSVFGEGGEDHLRCAYAVSRKELSEALGRMETFISAL